MINESRESTRIKISRSERSFAHLMSQGEMLVRFLLAVAFLSTTAAFQLGGLAFSRSSSTRGCRTDSTRMMGYPPGISYEPLPGAGEMGRRAGGNAGYGQTRLANMNPPPPPHALRGSTRLFLDTADVNAWGELMPLGMFYGITTNPVLLERAGVECSVKSLDSLSSSAFVAGAEEFMCQAWGQSVSELVSVGSDLAKLDPRIVVKMPLTVDGIAAANVLARRGGRICMTACYAPHQVGSDP